eukprot:3043267-Prymnesium_polylepis.1
MHHQPGPSPPASCGCWPLIPPTAARLFLTRRRPRARAASRRQHPGGRAVASGSDRDRRQLGADHDHQRGRASAWGA